MIEDMERIQRAYDLTPRAVKAIEELARVLNTTRQGIVERAVMELAERHLPEPARTRGK